MLKLMDIEKNPGPESYNDDNPYNPGQQYRFLSEKGKKGVGQQMLFNGDVPREPLLQPCSQNHRIAMYCKQHETLLQWKKNTATWNVRAAISPYDKLQVLVRDLTKFNVDIVCLQETRAIERVSKTLDNYTFLLGGGRRNNANVPSWGVGIGFRNDSGIKLLPEWRLFPSGRIMTADFKLPSKKVIRAVCIYAPASSTPEEQITEFWNDIDDIVPMSNEISCFWGGDLYTCLCDRDRDGASDVLGFFNMELWVSKDNSYSTLHVMLKWSKSPPDTNDCHPSEQHLLATFVNLSETTECMIISSTTGN
jgi:hypothetical protein